MGTRRNFSPEFKAQVALEAIRGGRPLAELASNHQLHPNLIMSWKRQAIERMANSFNHQHGHSGTDQKAENVKLYAKIGELLLEREIILGKCERKNGR
jgi:transposase